MQPPAEALHELTQLRGWLAEAFARAGEGLPWPHRLALRGVEEAVSFGMFGGLWATACALERQGASPRVREARAAIEGALWGHWPEPLGELRHQLVEAVAAGEEAAIAWVAWAQAHPELAPWADPGKNPGGPWR